MPLAAAIALAAACGGDGDDPIDPGESPLLGQYAYQVTGSEGTCDPLPRSAGGGVTRIQQTGPAARICWKKDLCDGEECYDGTIDGNTFRHTSTDVAQDGACVYNDEMTITDVRNADGSLTETITHRQTYNSGDCGTVVFPCTTTQTTVNTPCTDACYEVACAARGVAAAQEGARGWR